MNILIVTGIFPPDIGGPASYVPRIAAALVERGHSVDVVTLADDPLATAAAQTWPFAVHRIRRANWRPGRWARTISKIAVRARKADVVLANGLYAEAALAATIARKPAIAKVVGDTIWERARNSGWPGTLDEFQYATLPLRWRLLRAAQDAWIRSFDRILTPSAYLRSIAQGWGVARERIAVIYNAVPPPPMPANSGEPANDIVSVGRLVSWKGFEALIQIAGRRGWRLSIVGDGPLAESLEALSRSANAQVAFAGHLPQDRVADALRDARVFALNSSYEGLPHIVLEAMAAGVPVVASAAGGTPETIDDGRTGLLVPVADAAALESALAAILDDPAQGERFAAAASREIDTRFGFARMVEDTERLLDDVARAGR